jgi:hypothetical protein
LPYVRTPLEDRFIVFQHQTPERLFQVMVMMVTGVSDAKHE